MAITQNILNLDGYFKSTRGEKIIVNDYSYFSIKDKNELNNKLMTVYDNYDSTDVYDVRPRCDCGKLTARYNLGRVCRECGTEVIEQHENVKPIVWLKAVDDDVKFINPNYWLMLSELLKFKTKVDWMRYLTDPRYINRHVEIPSYIVGIKELLGNVRDYKTVMDNIPNILEYLLTHDSFKSSPAKMVLVKGYLDMYHRYKDDLFSSYVPIVNKRLFVVENTAKGKFINLVSKDTVEVVFTWLKLCTVNKDKSVSPKMLSSYMGTVLSRLASLYLGYYKDYVVTKPGAFRRHVYGARSHFTFRCVIVSVQGPHRHDELEVPWCVGLTAFRPHIINKLFKRGYTYKEINNMIFKYVKLYNPVIAEILDEIVAESPGGRGIPCTALRNPSLRQGSLQLCYIKKFKKDPTDNTVGISVLIIKAPNGDYDGDEMNFTILLDNNLAEQFKTLAPYHNVPDITRPYEVCSNVNLMPCASTILTNYLKSNDTNGQPDTIVDKLKFVTTK